MGTVIYILGIICAVWCVIDIFKKHISLILKIVLSIAVLASSWVGFAVYYILVRNALK